MGFSLKYASDRLRDDKEVVMEAVSNGYELFNVSDRLKSDKDVVLKAQQTFEKAYLLAPQHLKYDFDIKAARYEFNTRGIAKCHDRNQILRLIETKGYLFSYAKPKFKNDKEIILKFIEINAWQAVENASPQLKDDSDIIRKSVENCGLTIRLASERLKNNKEIALIAMKTSACKAIMDISDNLRQDREFLIEVVSYGSILNEHSSIELKSDRELRNR
ncbi:predicted protein [Naegleria gruberi]|uniref:Predicted protein n=1 Tax=Naegleria gruberi TaxID=5762 RepID=D2VGZ2_NAEGR|nr:uncharacterized protein NAEGRDRAFT_68219 [Naegleria gruberi]EFC43801.1 predicted protein [Naegleria gruberi]|eukprot:XP_002676545.1 predicted protein [Naegleria gruberi strain NEG-M]